jgi:hypothetical protein
LKHVDGIAVVEFTKRTHGISGTAHHRGLRATPATERAHRPKEDVNQAVLLIRNRQRCGRIDTRFLRRVLHLLREELGRELRTWHSAGRRNGHDCATKATSSTNARM